MRKLVIILLLVFVLTFVIAAPAFAAPSAEKKACDHIWGSGHYYGWFISNGEGIPWGPMWGFHSAGCSW